MLCFHHCLILGELPFDFSGGGLGCSAGTFFLVTTYSPVYKMLFYCFGSSIKKGRTEGLRKKGRMITNVKQSQDKLIKKARPNRVKGKKGRTEIKSSL